MRKYHLQILCLLLISVGLGLFAYKAFVLKYPLTTDERTEKWLIEAHASFNAKGKPLKLSLFVPKSSQRFLIMDESFVSRGFGLTTQFSEGNRQAIWTIRNASGQQGLYYRALVRRGSLEESRDKSKPKELVPSGFEGASLEAARAIVSEIRAKSADTESFVKALIQRTKQPESDSSITLLQGRHPSELRRLQTAVKILAEAGIHSRIAYGIILAVQTRNAPTLHRLEVFDGSSWLSFDPDTGDSTTPENFLPWWRGEESISSLSGGEKLKTVLSVAPHQERAVKGALSGATLTDPDLYRFSLFNLPLETQSVYRVILMIPIGAFIIVLLRNIVGIKTFGTFMPVLIALAFRETQLIWGIIFFSLLVGVGLAARFYLDHLKLLLVPRLASILTIVILLMAMMSVITHNLGVEKGLSVALFPMVILTMTIERMSIMWDEIGPYEAVKQGIGSILVGGLIYAIISDSAFSHIIFVFPELLLVLLAVTLMIGRYTGYRLVELKRFKALVNK